MKLGHHAAEHVRRNSAVVEMDRTDNAAHGMDSDGLDDGSRTGASCEGQPVPSARRLT
jgi:hypothetical protein